MDKFDIEKPFDSIKELKAMVLGLSSIREEDIPVECFHGILIHFLKVLMKVEEDMEAYMNHFVYTGSVMIEDEE